MIKDYIFSLLFILLLSIPKFHICYLLVICASHVSFHSWIWGSGLVIQLCPIPVTSQTAPCQAPLSMEILQARILQCIAMPSSRGSSQPRDRTPGSSIADRFFTICAIRETQEYWSGQPVPSPGDLPNPGIELGSPTCRQILYQLSYQGNLLCDIYDVNERDTLFAEKF